MDVLLLGLYALCSIASLVCFILVIVKMFQNEQTGLAIACILLIWCIGGLIAFVYGWINASAWGIQTIMMIWTVAMLGSIVLGIMTRSMLTDLG